MIDTADDPRLNDLDLVLAVPEWRVDLPGGTRPSHTDLLVLMRGTSGLSARAVVGKVDEPLGPTVGDKRR